MIRSKAKKRERLGMIMDRLEQLYPDASCALDFGGDAWRLLIMGRLSAQCTDARVNIVCKELFAKYPNAKSMAEAKIEDVEKIIRPCGLYRMKAESIVAASKMLEEDFGGTLPDDMDKLLLFPGVGRKIANLLLGDVFGKDAIVCDTHCIRICARFGMYSEKLKDAAKIEFILRELCDASRGSDFCHRIVTFGREVCTARSPRCESCPLSDLCEHYISKAKK